MALSDLDAASRHREVASAFGRVVDGVVDWQAPTPVEEWAAWNIVAHLVDWSSGFLSAGGIILPAAASVVDGPPAAWSAHAEAIQELLDGPSAAHDFTHPMAGTRSLADTIDMFYTADVYMHTWDLARSQGIVVDLDEGFARRMLDGMEPMDDILRASGQYGPKVEPAADADVVSRLMAFIGRDPGWAPPGIPNSE